MSRAWLPRGSNPDPLGPIDIVRKAAALTIRPRGRTDNPFLDHRNLIGLLVMFAVMRSSSQDFADLPKMDVDVGSLRYADVPVIQSDTDGIVCLLTDFVGSYRCFR